MKKQNIFELLCSDVIKEFEVKKKNFEMCINDFDKCIEENIIPFLIDNQERYGYVFDLQSHDDNIKNKSEQILSIITFHFEEVVSSTPTYFLDTVRKESFDIACKRICFDIFLLNNTKDLLKL